jgi:hypothetical protein
MLSKTSIIHDANEIFELVKHLPIGKNVLNSPSGDFFYDPWQVLPEYKGTSIEELLNKIPDAGEARINVLEPGESYTAHADIDDRYHLHLDGDFSFLVNLSDDKLYRLEKDNIVYTMDTSKLHTASNYGYKNRYQVVIRKRLKKSKLDKPFKIRLSAEETPYNLRYLFDNSFSIKLNWLNKINKLQDFKKVSDICIEFKIEKDYFKYIEMCCKTCGFKTKVEYL